MGIALILLFGLVGIVTVAPPVPFLGGLSAIAGLLMAQCFFAGGFLFYFRSLNSKKTISSTMYWLFFIKEWVDVFVFTILLLTPAFLAVYILVDYADKI